MDKTKAVDAAHLYCANARLHLSQVTLCAVTSVNVAATLRALETSLRQVRFGACRLFTDISVSPAHPEIEVIPIVPLRSSAAYSNFMLTRLVDHVETTHCLVTQWDGHLLNAGRWQAAFLDYDYVGASWPQFDDEHDVGNGGFSLRSRRLMELCRDPAFVPVHPEDMAIGRRNRTWLEGQGIRFAPRDLADAFAAERTGDPQKTFGYHGVWNMPRAIGPEAFWQVYSQLDERGTLRRDFASLLRDMTRGAGGVLRAGRMIADRYLGPFRP
ncbi:DUF5672 family protein [Asaia bogorensis]|uniref:DUF5672 family protein n=1 Tax=Asaia bogorensis TaxID=91915 RepID=UPI00197CAFC6|nr:DUF5672 family protein [Asaia bogorensis]